MMSTLNIRRLSNCFLVFSWLVLAITTATGQTRPEKQQQDQADDVVRVSTELVQTDVMVFDKKAISSTV